ncbi:heme ABC transporter permease CcmC [Xanthomonas campestris pv. raphani]|uniref:heme ABC transporter permease CcmC n=1 Tax=Xanthomonas campestris TaxID=339 RepID=UPI00021AEFD9|nr:heme ABC transporter permease CcmC [Xanthomonas campestris]AEL06791.1 heme exporter protein C-cytochrome C-type biogenesis protein [Xanthomonas campestris pv. raphani 756C]MEA9675638.1 heme ABC transporter permease CcmC [Xanthomonas campestris pv. raphani]MEA9774582.1 heme ABC transporter permease CcmC [Xanthomonas campestris pv. raphani]MEA9915585.1 heme ABC transporter permease CcmC [Xanthomonas campestris pv. raphani]
MAKWIPLWLHKLSSPPTFYRFAGVVRPWALGQALLLATVAAYGGLVLAPPDYQQHDAYRIIFIHVPSAWMSLFIYAAMGVSAFIALIWRIKLAEVVTMASAPIGAAFTLITLCTGSLWGKPMWGTWWTWDARLTSELLLLFLYLGVLGLYHAVEDRRQAMRAAGLLALVGLVNLPIVHYSVVWWNTLHQGSTVRLLGPSKMGADMLWPLLLMLVATKLYYVASLFGRVRVDLLALESGKDWARRIVLTERTA